MNNRYRQVFLKRNTLIIVVHVDNEQQAMRNVRIAQDEGVDGVFLINHQISAKRLLKVYARVKQLYPSLWIGLNCLDLSPIETLEILPNNVDGLWFDNPGISEEDHDPVALVRNFSKSRDEHGQYGICFGGVAFKYQKPTKDPARVAKLVAPFIDVITTSGDGTGIAASFEKIRLMKKSIGDHPLAIASGITPENVRAYMPYADCFLVATGVSDSHSELNPTRVRKLVQIVSS